ncbi:MAG: DUF2141 domain-containing protein [Sphingomonas sp.]|nr:DUF2141 domain-containing protein [Sphingomonas sp.]
MLLLPQPAAAYDGATIEIHIEGLRNMQGIVRLCLTRNQAHFPDCNGDPAAIKRSIPAAQAAHVRIEGAASGSYALAVIHDENSNGRLDRFMAIPREGFGFSRNPGLRMGPPRFDEVRFEVTEGSVRQNVRLRYLI